jgi:hypothetical protein
MLVEDHQCRLSLEIPHKVSYLTLPHDQEVAKRHDRMIEEHPGAGIVHHNAYATAHFGIVAMH